MDVGGRNVMAAVPIVLIVDDDQDFRASVKSLLESEGYAVFEADSGKDGLRKLVEQKPDVILLDVMMENPTEGYGVNYSIKYRDEFAEYREVPIFMISSIEESPDERFPFSSEVDMIRPDRYLTKPLDIPTFLAAVQKAVAAHAVTR